MNMRSRQQLSASGVSRLGQSIRDDLVLTVDEASPVLRRKTFRVDGLVGVTAAAKAAVLLAALFYFCGSALMFSALTFASYYLLMDYSTKDGRTRDHMEMNRLESRLRRGAMRFDDVLRFLVARLISLCQSLAALKKSVVGYSFTVSIAENSGATEAGLPLLTHDNDSIRSSDLRRKRSPSLENVIVEAPPASEKVVFEKGNESNDSKIYDAFGVEFEPRSSRGRRWINSKQKAHQAIDLSTSAVTVAPPALPSPSPLPLPMSPISKPVNKPIFHHSVPVIPVDMEPSKDVDAAPKEETKPASPVRKNSRSPKKHKNQVSVWMPRSLGPRLILKPRPSTLTADQSVDRMIKDVERMMRETEELLARSHKLFSDPSALNKEVLEMIEKSTPSEASTDDSEGDVMEQIAELCQRTGKLESLAGEYFDVEEAEEDEEDDC
ncbi:hypothetical protein Poli38472_013513 [Pythium oligandrum]|uniref:Uncharacterized protein n=1 Tax=Pythium oligandrum TaxID=41045 RepID=A0A8K1C7U2_PYTOL|nr:hypothetical protein Poli38472_013513 [Pythium oligandrum]|eukprot:TMW58039.1 hypothetical protein Poli38472_013513 [Pythium oligandrum]